MLAPLHCMQTGLPDVVHRLSPRCLLIIVNWPVNWFACVRGIQYLFARAQQRAAVAVTEHFY